MKPVFTTPLRVIQGKAFQLAEYTMNTGDPEYYKKDLAAIQSVTMEDVKAVYNKYINGKNFIETSFVPKGKTNLIAEGSVKCRHSGGRCNKGCRG